MFVGSDALVSELHDRQQDLVAAIAPLDRVQAANRVGEIVAKLSAIRGIAFSANFKAWFGASVVRDGQGRPLVVFRGEHGPAAGDTGVSTMLGSITFTDAPAVAAVYAVQPNQRGLVAVRPRVIGAYLRIENPIMDNRDDPFLELGLLEQRLGRDEAVRIARKFADRIEYTGNWIEGLAEEFESVGQMMDQQPHRVAELYFDAYPFLDDAEEVAKLRAAGFDGAVHVGNGESIDALEFRVFSVRQIKSVGNSGRFDPAAESIMDGAAQEKTWRVERPQC